MGLIASLPEPTETAPRRSTARTLVALSLLVFTGALFGLLQGLEPFTSWFFVFAWWSYIFLLDGLTYLRRGSSILLDRPRGFLYLVPWSAAFWLFFELANLQLSNWYYVGLPASATSRFIGIFVSFATVLPGIFETTDFLSTFRVAERARCNPHTWRVTPGRRSAMSALGLIFLIAPLLFPRYAFPLIWGATALLLEPQLAKRGETSIWSHLAAGRPAVPLRLLLAGAICGLCWESWNFWASAKWIYTVPFFEELKLFEMPLLGFLGFPPFALECYTFARFLVARNTIPEWETDLPRRVVSRRRQVSWALASLLFCAPAIYLVDRYLVRSTAMQLDEFQSLGEKDVATLRAAGILDGHMLQRAFGGRAALPPMELDFRNLLLTELDLSRTAWMGARGITWLGSVGIGSTDELELREPNSLTGELQIEGSGPAPVPSAAEVRYWVRAAARR